MRSSFLVAALFFLAGCQNWNVDSNTAKRLDNQANKLVSNKDICLFDEPPAEFSHNCDSAYWLNQWIAASEKTWQERKSAIQSFDESPFHIVLTYIYTLPNDTPYQDRLRAQLALDKLAASFTPIAAKVIATVAGAQNTHMMELESALVVLEKENTARGEKINVLEKEAVTLRTKIEELLRIEATLMDKSRSTQQ